MFLIGDEIVAIEAPDYLRMIHIGGRYVVNKVDARREDCVYLTILGDDNCGHPLLSTLFRRADERKARSR